MPKYLLIFFCLALHFANAQEKKPTKSQLLKLFNQSIQQDKKGKVLVGSNSWMACNKDSSFFKSDTIKLINNGQYLFQGCCDFIEWTFYKKAQFVINKTALCKEPTTGSVLQTTDWFTINFVKSKGDLVFEIVNQNKPVYRFKVISIESVLSEDKPATTATIVTLVRQTNATNDESSLESTI